MSGRSSRSLVRPLKRTSPFSRKTARSASSSATLTDCSTTTIVVPEACSSLTTCEQLGHHGRRQAERELVDHEHLRRHHERHGQREHLLLAAREVARLLVRPLAQNREQVDHPLLGLGHGAVVLADHPGAEPEVLVHREGREDAAPARHEREALPGDRLRLLAGDRRAVEPDRAAADLDQPAGALEQRRLAGAVGAEQRHDLALVHLEVDAEEDLHRAVGDLDLLARQHDRRVGDEPVGRRAADLRRTAAPAPCPRRGSRARAPGRVARRRCRRGAAATPSSSSSLERVLQEGRLLRRVVDQLDLAGRPPGSAPGSGGARPRA